VEALLEADGLANRAGPRPLIELGVVEEPRLALLSCREVRIR
jgi:hypothetical protein